MSNLQEIYIGYFLLINLYGIFIMYFDKQKARKGKWRIPEKNIFITAMLLGSIGVLIGMHLFRHKTKHWKFLWGIPGILIIQLYIFFRFFRFF